MGGPGSGTWQRNNTKPITVNQLKIDIQLLNKLGYLKKILLSYSTLIWSKGDNKIASIDYRIQSDCMVIKYKYKANSEDWKTVKQEILFNRTPCNYGGYRPWFFCPQCHRRIAILYFVRNYFLCRFCNGLNYACQQERHPYRMLRKSRKIRNRLDPRNIITDPFPSKPKNMQWKTYDRLRDEAWRAETMGWYLMSQQIGIRKRNILP